MNVPKLDPTPLPTDWEDIQALFADMRKFAEENPRHTFLSADDPGQHYEPCRVPRFGWVAFLDNAEDEREKSWTITLANVRKTLADGPPTSEALRESLKTQTGRQKLLEAVIGRTPTP